MVTQDHLIKEDQEEAQKVILHLKVLALEMVMQDHLTREDQEEAQKVIPHLKVLETEIIHQELKAKLLV